MQVLPSSCHPTLISTAGVLLHLILPHSLRCPADACLAQVAMHSSPPQCWDRCCLGHCEEPSAQIRESRLPVDMQGHVHQLSGYRLVHWDPTLKPPRGQNHRIWLLGTPHSDWVFVWWLVFLFVLLFWVLFFVFCFKLSHSLLFTQKLWRFSGLSERALDLLLGLCLGVPSISRLFNLDCRYPGDQLQPARKKKTGTDLTTEHMALLQHPSIPAQFPSKVTAPLQGGEKEEVKDYVSEIISCTDPSFLVRACNLSFTRSQELISSTPPHSVTAGFAGNSSDPVASLDGKCPSEWKARHGDSSEPRASVSAEVGPNCSHKHYCEREGGGVSGPQSREDDQQGQILD